MACLVVQNEPMSPAALLSHPSCDVNELRLSFSHKLSCRVIGQQYSFIPSLWIMLKSIGARSSGTRWNGAGYIELCACSKLAKARTWKWVDLGQRYKRETFYRAKCDAPVNWPFRISWVHHHLPSLSPNLLTLSNYHPVVHSLDISQMNFSSSSELCFPFLRIHHSMNFRSIHGIREGMASIWKWSVVFDWIQYTYCLLTISSCEKIRFDVCRLWSRNHELWTDRFVFADQVNNVRVQLSSLGSKLIGY